VESDHAVAPKHAEDAFRIHPQGDIAVRHVNHDGAIRGLLGVPYDDRLCPVLLEATDTPAFGRRSASQAPGGRKAAKCAERELPDRWGAQKPPLVEPWWPPLGDASEWP
jgi:hypothetical protein